MPTRETWKLMEESVWDTAVTRVVPACLTVGRMSLTDVRGHDAGPLWASSTFQRLGWVYHASAGPSSVALPSQLDGDGFTPESTTGSLLSGVTSAASRTT